MPVTVKANSRDEASMQSWGTPRPSCPVGRTISSTPANPTTAAPMRCTPTVSRSMKAARGTSHRVRVKLRALASARGIFWKA